MIAIIGNRLNLKVVVTSGKLERVASTSAEAAATVSGAIS
jgi:hypothetical protein